MHARMILESRRRTGTPKIYLDEVSISMVETRIRTKTVMKARQAERDLAERKFIDEMKSQSVQIVSAMASRLGESEQVAQEKDFMLKQTEQQMANVLSHYRSAEVRIEQVWTEESQVARCRLQETLMSAESQLEDKWARTKAVMTAARDIESQRHAEMQGRYNQEEDALRKAVERALMEAGRCAQELDET